MTFSEVPPPPAAPVQSRAQELGLPRGLRVTRTDHQFRCAECHDMQHVGSEGVWVPDGIRRTDPQWAVEESARLNAFNGSSALWCLDCTKRWRVKPSAPTVSETSAAPPRRKFLGIF